MNKSRYNIKWDNKYKALSAFLKTNPGQWPAENSKRISERSLAKWCRDPRTAWKEDRLTAVRYKTLKAIRFPFAERTLEGKWMKQYNRIKTFYKINSHYPTDAGSLSWISQQQLRYNDLSPAQRSLLRTIHFKQETRRNLRQEMRQQHWAGQLQKLKSFYTRHRRLPSRSDDSSLHSWLYHLRTAVKTGSLDKTRKKLLSQTGINVMSSTFRKKSWEDRLSELADFQEKRGIPSLRKKDKTYEPGLYQWVSIQKTRHTKGELSAIQTRQLKKARVL